MTRRVPLLLIVLGVVVAAFVAAIAASRSNDHKTTTTPAGVRQTQPVSVTGAALPTFSGDTASDPAVGQPMPTLRGKSFDGTPLTIAPDGHPKVIAFVAHWCPHCQREVPLLANWLHSHQLPAGLELYAVMDHDGEATKAYGVRALPSTFLIDQRGVLKLQRLGPLATGGPETTWSEAWLANQVRSLLASG